MPSLLDVRSDDEPERLALQLDERRLLAIESALGSLEPKEAYDEETTLEISRTLSSLASFAEAKAVSPDGWPVLARIIERGSAWLEARPDQMPTFGLLWTREDLDAFAADLTEWERGPVGPEEERMLRGFVQNAELERFADEAAQSFAAPLVARARQLLAA